MCVCVCVCVCVQICVCVHVYMCLCVCCVSVCTYMHACMYVYLCTCMCTTHTIQHMYRSTGSLMYLLVKPNDSIEVQMIGGLVQQQQCRLQKQCPKMDLPCSNSNTQTHTYYTRMHARTDTHTLLVTLSFSNHQKTSWSLVPAFLG